MSVFFNCIEPVAARCCSMGHGDWRLGCICGRRTFPRLSMEEEWATIHVRTSLHRMFFDVLAGVLRRLGLLPLLQP